MSLFHTNKRYISIFFIFLLLTTYSLNAKNCDSQIFNIKIGEKVATDDILNQLSNMCGFSIVSKDQNTTNVLNQKINGINIRNMTLSEIFDLLISDKNLNYDFKSNVLKIYALKTKIFKLDYITSIREGNSITKASVDSSPSEVGGSSSSSDGQASGSSDNIIKTTEKFDFWTNLQKDIKSILNNGSETITAPDPIINQNAGLITVTGTNSQIMRVGKYITELQNRLKKQVMIDVKIISVSLDNDYTKGVDWSKFQLSFNSFLNNDPNNPFALKSRYTWGNQSPIIPSASSGVNILPSIKASDSNGAWALGANVNFNLQGMINFLQTKGKTKVVSSPKILTLNNQQALISVGDTINYTIKETSTNDSSQRTNETSKQYSIFIGILLNLLPEIGDNNQIILRINPSLSNFKYAQDDEYHGGSNERSIAPDTIQKKLSTVVSVNSGDTIVIGGLIGETKGKSQTKVPLLGDIPLFGNLFKSTKDSLRTTELIFVITPKIVNNTSSTSVYKSLKDLGFSNSLYEK